MSFADYATTRVGMLSAPLRDRFGMVDKLEFYTHDDLREIVMRSAEVLGVDIDEEGALEIARRSRGTPRLANRLLKRCRDYAEVCHDGHIDHDVAKAALDKLQVDSMGLDVNDRNILMTMIEKFAGGPVGLDTLAAAVGEDPGTIAALPALFGKSLCAFGHGCAVIHRRTERRGPERRPCRRGPHLGLQVEGAVLYLLRQRGQ